MPTDDEPPLSGWLGTAADDGGEHPFQTAEDARYDRGNLLGWGGMGTVHAARDRRLRREVAWKQGADARLPQEAWIAAQLEHPGIVPVYDAGHDERGQPFYTMRLVRGRTLAAALAAAEGLAGRLRLLRHFLATCQAMAYAHDVGVVHRDLKPANVMVGEFGETQVVDWGIASPIGAADEALDLIPPEHTAHTLAGSVVGTPAYMSPEQARGLPPDPRADVWSLGVILYELLAGRLPFDGETSDEVLEHVLSGDLPPLGPEAPAELSAIASRALERDPERRYPHAGALADDVEAWLDGRRVGAHEYTAAELAVRFARAWRGPLIAGALGLVGIAVATAVAVVRIDRARVAAERAEAQTQEALAIADQRLGRSLAGLAVDANLRRAPAEAELLAAQALVLVESPSARGVLAASAGARLERRSTEALPCRRPLLGEGGELALCVGSSVSLWDTATTTRLWERPVPGEDGVMDATSGRLLVRSGGLLRALELATGEVLYEGPISGEAQFVQSDPGTATIAVSGAVHQVELSTLEWRTVPTCEGLGTQLAAVRAGQLVVQCNGGGWEAGPVEGPLVALPSPVPEVSALAWLDGGRIAVGARGGAVDVFAGPGGARLWGVHEPGGRIGSIEPAGEGVLVTSDQLAPRLVWSHGSTRLPHGAISARFAPGALVSAGPAGIERWRVRPPPLLELPVGNGITSVDLSPDGRLLAVTDGGGFVNIVGVDGARIHTLRWQERVLKGGAFTLDGSRYAAVAIGQSGARVFDTADWSWVPSSEPAFVFRRIAPLGDGFAGLSYSNRLVLLDRDGAPRGEPELLSAADLGASSRGVAAMGDEVRVIGVEPPVAPFAVADALAVDLAEDGRIAVATRDGIALFAPDGSVLAELPTDERFYDLAWSPDGRWIAAGALSGLIQLWAVDERAVRAELRGHRQRVVALAFSADGARLYSGSWDGTVRGWALEVMDADPEGWLRAAERAWGRTAEEAASVHFGGAL